MRSAPSPSTMARSSTSTRSSSGRPAPASTSPPRITPGSVGPTKTPTAWCDSTCPSARAWPTSPSTIAIGSLRNSTAGRGSGWAIGLRRNAMRGKTQCCTSKLISDGVLTKRPLDMSSPRSDRLDEPLNEVERRLGDLAPAVVDREGVAPVRHLHDLRHGGVAPLPLVGGVRDRPRYGVVLLAVNDQQGTAVGALRVHLRLRPRVEVRVTHLHERDPGGGDVERVVELPRLLFVQGVHPAVLELVEKEARELYDTFHVAA